MSDLTPDELEHRTREAEQRFRESIEYVTEDDIEAAARSSTVEECQSDHLKSPF